jgi:hypothetical protein
MAWTRARQIRSLFDEVTDDLQGAPLSGLGASTQCLVVGAAGGGGYLERHRCDLIGQGGEGLLHCASRTVNGLDCFQLASSVWRSFACLGIAVVALMADTGRAFASHHRGVNDRRR